MAGLLVFFFLGELEKLLFLGGVKDLDLYLDLDREREWDQDLDLEKDRPLDPDRLLDLE